MSDPTKIFQYKNFYHENLITRIFLDLRYLHVYIDSQRRGVVLETKIPMQDSTWTKSAGGLTVANLINAPL